MQYCILVHIAPRYTKLYSLMAGKLQCALLLKIHFTGTYIALENFTVI